MIKTVDSSTAQTSSLKNSNDLSHKIRSQFSSATQNFLNQGLSKQAVSQVPSQDVKSEQPQSTQPLVSDQEKLTIFEKVLDEVEADRQVNNSSTQQQTQSDSELTQEAMPVPASAGRKEAGPVSSNAVEQAASIQYVETEKSPEISPEVEKYINEVKEDQDKAPKEIVIADTSQDLAGDDQYTAEPVIVIPITPELEKKGKKKSPKFSLRWLVEWSQKIMKMFSGKVIYRQEPD